MSCNDHNTLPYNPVVSVLRVFAVLLALSATPAFALDSGDIVVVSAKGEVHVTMKGAARPVRAGTTLELPATVRTGRDGAIELRQGATTVSVAADTLLEFPALEKPGAPIDRIQQPRGNAFYNIGKRQGRKLRVETPYLVGVVKGTQFNVAAQDEATTISLFEGLLEIRSADESSVADIRAGEIATGRRGDTSISVIKMEPGKAPPAGPRQQGGASGNGGADPTEFTDSRTVTVQVDDLRGVDRAIASPVTGTITGPDASGAVSTDVREPVGGVSADAGAGVSNVVDTSTTLDAGRGGAAVDVGHSTQVDAGPVSVSVENSTSVDTGAGGAAVDVTHSTRVDTGAVSVDVDTSTSVDVGAGGAIVDVSHNTSVDAGPVSVDVDTGAGVNVDTGGASAAVDTGASLDVPVAPVDVPVSVGADVDLGNGTVDLGVSVADAVDLGVDLGLGDADNGHGNETVPTTDTSNPAPATPADLGGLLDGLLRRPGRR